MAEPLRTWKEEGVWVEVGEGEGEGQSNRGAGWGEAGLHEGDRISLPLDAAEAEAPVLGRPPVA